MTMVAARDKAIDCFLLEETSHEVTRDDGMATSPTWRRADTGQEYVLGHEAWQGIPPAPPGAMWFADWYGEKFHGPDGKTLVVRTPGGDWIVDGPSYNGDQTEQHVHPWTRTGTAPNVTVRPSILMHRSGYHAFLTEGRLVEL